MLGTADDRTIGWRSGRLDEPANGPAATRGGDEVECPTVDLRSDRHRGLAPGLGAPTDESEIAPSGQESHRRTRDAFGAGHGAHLEIVTQDEAGEAETPAEETADHLR